MTSTSRSSRATTLAAVAAAVLVLAACGKKHDTATQAAARVDGAEITVHQINYRLQKMRGLRNDDVDAASRKVLEQLIDEQLAVEKAEKAKLDQTPQAQQAMDAARRETLARAYAEQVGQGVAAPTDDALHRYYDDNDALFTHRRVYTLQEFVAEVPADKIPALQAIVEGGKPVDDVVAWLKAQGAPYKDQQSTRGAEQIPLGALKPLAALQDGHGMMVSRGTQVRIVYILSSTAQPVAFERAKPAITQYLVAESRRKNIESNLAALKTAAKIEYAAPYAALAASQAPAPTLQDVQASAPVQADGGTRVSLPQAGQSSGVQVTLPNASSSVQVTLPNSTAPGVRVSLPDQAASGGEVHLPPQGGADAGKK